MATNRVLLGNRTGGSGGGYGLYVSKANSDVLTCDNKDLLFTSNERAGAGGLIYAGGSQSSVSSGINFLTTGSKSSLGYIPMVILIIKEFMSQEELRLVIMGEEQEDRTLALI